jgi:hypothetical protein
MTTVLAVYSTKGCVGRCDANCYNAKHHKCTCICGGENHSKGFECAEVNNVRSVGLTPAALLAYAAATNRDARELTVIDRLHVRNARHARKRARDKLLQPDLFDERITP